MSNTDTNKTDLLLLLLYAKGKSGKNNEPITGITRLMKLLFLLRMEESIDDAFTFEPYKMGPFSNEVYPELEFLKNYPTPEHPLLDMHSSKDTSTTFNPEQVKLIDDISLFEDEPLSASEINTEFSLSTIGEKIASQLWNDASPKYREAVQKIKSKYSTMTLKDLLKYVYSTYPDMTIKSEIIGQVL